MPLIRRIPKRGFNNAAFKVSYLPVNLEALNAFDDGSTVNAEVLRQAGIAKGPGIGVKVLANGELKKKLVVKASAFSAAAKAAIEKLGGTAELVS